MSALEPEGNQPLIPEFPPSLLRAAEHLKAKFQELPWFISVHPATIEGRICLALHIKDHGIPRGMVLPTSFETFKVVIQKTGVTKTGLQPIKTRPSPLW